MGGVAVRKKEKNRKKTALDKAHFDEFRCEEAKIAYILNKQTCEILS